MYTIKIILKRKKEPDATYYIEVRNPVVRMYYAEEKEDGNDLAKSIGVERQLKSEVWHANANKEADKILLIGYFDGGGLYGYMMVYGGKDFGAHLYIMQNGKTIDKYYV